MGTFMAILSIFIFMLVCMVIAILTCDIQPTNTTAYKTSNKHCTNSRSINTYGKYNQAKRYYGYARGKRKLW